MHRRFFFAFAFAAVLLLPASLTFSQESSGEATAETDAETVSKPKLSSVELMRKAAKADADTRYGLLNQISPRGASKDDRAEMVELLIDQLGSSYPDLRARAARVLSLFGDDAAPAVPELMRLIGDVEQTVTLESVWVPVSKTLSALGPDLVLEPLLEELGRTFDVRTAKDKDTGEYTVDWGDRVKYYGVTAAIAGLGEDAKQTAPVFVDLLRNGPENRRWATMYTLSQFGDAAAPAIPDFIRNLEHNDFNYKVMACRSLAVHGEASKAAVPKLVELMKKKGNMLSTRTHAAMCLGAIGPVDDVDSVELFTEMIKEPNAFSQERGLIALGRFGEHAKDAHEFVRTLLDDADFSQKPEAARTLWQITGDAKQTIEVLTALIDDRTYDTRVLSILKEMGEAASPMGGLLAERLQTDDQSMRQTLVEILVGMGPAAKKHVTAIKAALEGAAPDTAVMIDKAIAKIETWDRVKPGTE